MPAARPSRTTGQPKVPSARPLHPNLYCKVINNLPPALLGYRNRVSTICPQRVGQEPNPKADRKSEPVSLPTSNTDPSRKHAPQPRLPITYQKYTKNVIVREDTCATKITKFKVSFPFTSLPPYCWGSASFLSPPTLANLDRSPTAGAPFGPWSGITHTCLCSTYEPYCLAVVRRLGAHRLCCLHHLHVGYPGRAVGGRGGTWPLATNRLPQPHHSPRHHSLEMSCQVCQDMFPSRGLAWNLQEQTVADACDAVCECGLSCVGPSPLEWARRGCWVGANQLKKKKLAIRSTAFRRSRSQTDMSRRYRSDPTNSKVRHSTCTLLFLCLPGLELQNSGPWPNKLGTTSRTSRGRKGSRTGRSSLLRGTGCSRSSSRSAGLDMVPRRHPTFAREKQHTHTPRPLSCRAACSCITTTCVTASKLLVLSRSRGRRQN